MNFQLADEFLKRIIDSPFDLEAFSDSDYAGASLDRKSITIHPVQSSSDSEEIKANGGIAEQKTNDKDADEVSDKGDDDVSQINGQEKERGASNKEDDQHVQDFKTELDRWLVLQKEGYANSTNIDSTASPSVSTAGPSINTASENINTGSPNINTASPISNDSKADLNNLETTMNGSLIPTTRIHKDHPKDQIIGDINLAIQTRRMINFSEENAMVLWIQNQMLDYGFNFMNTKIYIDNESTICIVKNPVFHSKTKHIEIRHHFIRDSYEKKLIQVIKIHTDHNVADLLTKAFDVSSAALYICIGIADNTHKSFVSGKAIWNYAYKCSGLYIMDAYNGVQELPSDKNRLILVTAT
ncbi:hypothetical protein Tco_0332836 [Tanacetum coccineum]